MLQRDMASESKLIRSKRGVVLNRGEGEGGGSCGILLGQQRGTMLQPALQPCLCRVPGELHSAAAHPAQQLPAPQTRLQTQRCAHHHPKGLPSNLFNVEWLRGRDRKLWFAFSLAELLRHAEKGGLHCQPKVLD